MTEFNKDLKSMKWVEFFCLLDLNGKTPKEAADIFMALHNKHHSRNREVLFEVDEKNPLPYASLYMLQNETQEDSEELREFKEYKRLKAKFG